MLSIATMTRVASHSLYEHEDINDFRLKRTGIIASVGSKCGEIEGMAENSVAMNRVLGRSVV